MAEQTTTGTGTDLFEIIRTTRSMRRLKTDPVPGELIRQILEAGTVLGVARFGPDHHAQGRWLADPS